MLEGFHPLKHALRHSAVIETIVTPDLPLLAKLSRRLAPDVWPSISESASVIDPDTFAQLAPVPPETGVLALARRRLTSPTALLHHRRSAPLILLENPSHLGNVGASIRVAASAGAAGVITTGPQDPWHPTAVRGAAGLQYALPVGRVDQFPVPAWTGPLIALHPEGEYLTPGSIPSDAILAFGSERQGLSDALLRQADRRLAIPMEPNVSSLNLATAVAVVLYTWRLSPPPAP